MGLPGDLHHEADGHAGVLVRAAEGVDDVELLVAELFLRQIENLGPDFLAHGVVVVLIALAGPPHGVLGVFVHDDVLVLGGAAGVDAGHNVDSAELGQRALVKTLEGGVHLSLKQFLIAGVADDLRRAGNTVLAQINLCHIASILFLIKK